MKEELGSSKYENECIFKDFNYEDFKKNFKVHKRQVYFLKICTIVGPWVAELTSDALKIVPTSVMFYYCVWYDF